MDGVKTAEQAGRMGRWWWESRRRDAAVPVVARYTVVFIRCRISQISIYEEACSYKKGYKLTSVGDYIDYSKQFESNTRTNAR